MKHKKYIVHEVRGGLMEDPDFHYHDEEEIIADSKEEAVAIYDRRNSCYYFSGSVKEKIGKTDEPKTSDEPLNKEKHKNRIEFYNGEDVRWKKHDKIFRRRKNETK
jgi:hypothetical protein